MIISFYQGETDGMKVNKLSSLLRGTKNVRLALETIINNLPAVQLAGKVSAFVLLPLRAA